MGYKYVTSIAKSVKAGTVNPSAVAAMSFEDDTPWREG